MDGADSIAVQINDALRLCRLREKPVFGGFLNEEEIAAALDIIKRNEFSDYMLWGGRSDSERSVIGLFPNGIEPSADCFPIKTLRLSYSSRFNPGHRDFLGSLMALGIKRSCVGDILTGSGEAFVFVKAEISDYIAAQLNRIGKIGVKVSCGELPDDLITDDSTLLNLTVSSLRLDNVVSEVLNLSRDKGARAVKSGLVSVNHTVKLSPSFNLKENDSVVFRGKGKFVLQELAGESKKGRKRIIIKKFR